MTPAAQTSEPQTAAGRRILRQDYRGNEAYTVTRQDILAIEAEAAALPAAPAGLDEGRVRALFREMWHESMHPGDGIDESCVVCIRKADDLIEYCRAYAEGEPE